jgi:hypothetical protein
MKRTILCWDRRGEPIHSFERIRATLLMHHNRGYGTRNVEVNTLPIFINGKSEAMVQPQRPKRRRVMGSFERKILSHLLFASTD